MTEEYRHLGPEGLYRHLTPEDLANFVPGVFRYEQEADTAERAVEAYRGHLRARVHTLPHDFDAKERVTVLLDDVLALLPPDDEDQQGDGQ